ncbi:hypothetical protein ICNINCKA_01267 [Synechococcus sp. CBW1107]|nr:hypothetical protein ICNINCKA_01267 [Synechococcus sp. CBW1107]
MAALCQLAPPAASVSAGQLSGEPWSHPRGRRSALAGGEPPTLRCRSLGLRPQTSQPRWGGTRWRTQAAAPLASPARCGGRRWLTGSTPAAERPHCRGQAPSAASAWSRISAESCPGGGPYVRLSGWAAGRPRCRRPGVPQPWPRKDCRSHRPLLVGSWSCWGTTCSLNCVQAAEIPGRSIGKGAHSGQPFLSVADLPARFTPGPCGLASTAVADAVDPRGSGACQGHRRKTFTVR